MRNEETFIISNTRGFTLIWSPCREQCLAQPGLSQLQPCPGPEQDWAALHSSGAAAPSLRLLIIFSPLINFLMEFNWFNCAVMFSVV